MPTQAIFQTGLYFDFLDLDNHKIKQLCVETFNKNVSTQVSNKGGHQIHIDDLSLFDYFCDYIIEHAQIYCSDIGMKQLSLEIKDLWINFNNKNNWNFPHNHLGSGAIISGVYYVQTDNNSGDITFLNPDNGFNAIFNETGNKIFTPYNSSKWCVSPKERKLLLFPSSLVHLVEPSSSDQERISISFNIYYNKD